MEQLLSRTVKFAFPIGIGMMVLSESMYNVPAGQRVVIFDRLKGIRAKPMEEGTHFLIPWLQKPIFFDVRLQSKVITTNTGSKDMQRISLSLRVLFRPRKENLNTIYSRLGPDYAERVLPSIGNEVLKAVVAQFDAGELITQREPVSQKIREELTMRAQEFNIELEDVSITHLSFGKEFTLAVEQKQVAQQDAERAKFVVEKAEREKTAAVVRAEGESQAASLISQAIERSGSGLIELRRIEAAKEIASVLSASSNVTYLPSGSNTGPSLLLNIKS
ncbi:Prohibitin-1 [Mitosporidium daphniae]|uniref:Prohibitin n=1 Tax=Mitosporidium daphniae TaxID=1485682 RepID=A0A098VLJ1_9MICR|nr:uncharacterized protein DI09_99p70 [Mitosporidium daphniae]KGG49962.1 hypothetical protein DI09_99p70 [Mitosporidium daphniae]|eukprot:XP_013236398.1 uncharacterized protein DI09_99p70 [Mitosporidium daphniae]